MTLPSIHFAAGDRVLVAAPHPDDETLACGELIQFALDCGARVRVLLASDGDNNPWPQRWLERRVWIGAAARARWGARRRGEALAAAAVLGLEAAQVRCLGWPDQGLTASLMAGDEGVAVLADELDGFAPSHLVMPALDDRHPDHGAPHVALELALLRSGLACRRICYRVHGGAVAGELAVPPAAARQQRKRAALACHRSQLALSRGRLLALAQRPEWFTQGDEPGAGRGPALPLVFRIGALPALHARHELLVVLATAEGTVRARLPLAWFGQRVAGTAQLDLQCDGDTLRLTPAATLPAIRAGWAKLHRREPRWVVFDRHCWQRARS